MRTVENVACALAIMSLVAVGACGDNNAITPDFGASGDAIEQRVFDGAPGDAVVVDRALPDGGSASAPRLESIDPSTHAGGVAFTITLLGERFESDNVAAIDGQPVQTVLVSQGELTLAVPPQSRGSKLLTVSGQNGTSNALSLDISNSVPRITDPGPQGVDEEQEATIPLTVSDFDGDGLRVFVSGLPAGAVWDETKKQIRFRPDFIQGGKTHTIAIVATDGRDEATASFALSVRDAIQPPAPTVVRDEDKGSYRLVTLSQVTDAFLDSPGHAGRSFLAHVTVPKAASDSHRLPVNVSLHGFDVSPSTDGRSDRFMIYPHDADDTYWWGYAASLPGVPPAAGAMAPPYTRRRVLALLQWVLDRYPGADPERTYISGSSMGGAGAKMIGLLDARHFCYVEATIGQAIPRNHRPLRIAQLSTLWGSPQDNLTDGRGTSIWDRMDVTRVMRDDLEAKNQFVFTKHGKDDEIIHFGAAVQPSALTGRSFYQALQYHRVGHYVVWDEGGHGLDGPVMGAFWSDWGWDRVTDSETFLRRDVLFPAFSNSSADQDPGTGHGNGKQPWDDNRGYAGVLSVAGDTGWDGEVAGCRNRFLRWKSTAIVDTHERIELPLKVLDGNGEASPRPGYPTKGNKLDKALPVTVDVTLRRVQRFSCLPGETVAWQFGSGSGTAQADADGALTIPRLALTTSWTTLVVTRR